MAAPTNSFLLDNPLGPMGTHVVAEPSTASVLSALRAAVLPFRKSDLPPLVRHVAFNDDLLLGSFRPSKMVWPGEQRRGISTHLTDDASPQDHVRKSTDRYFPWLTKFPLPEGISHALQFAMATPIAFRKNSGRKNRTWSRH